MARHAREFAKFVSGIAAHETLGHWWLGTFGRDWLPLKLSWFTFTREMNVVAMAAWPVVLAALVYFAWFSRGARGRP
jgi:hypothetical protein